MFSSNVSERDFRENVEVSTVGALSCVSWSVQGVMRPLSHSENQPSVCSLGLVEQGAG